MDEKQNYEWTNLTQILHLPINNVLNVFSMYDMHHETYKLQM
jgi:hypothetical protein